MIKVKHFIYGRHDSDGLPGHQLEKFLAKNNISRSQIISINMAEDDVMLVYEDNK